MENNHVPVPFDASFGERLSCQPGTIATARPAALRNRGRHLFSVSLYRRKRTENRSVFGSQRDDCGVPPSSSLCSTNSKGKWGALWLFQTRELGE
jgi:hypothetical protein